jgi:hypothetical protein
MRRSHPVGDSAGNADSRQAESGRNPGEDAPPESNYAETLVFSSCDEYEID